MSNGCNTQHATAVRNMQQSTQHNTQQNTQHATCNKTRNMQQNTQQNTQPAKYRKYDAYARRMLRTFHARTSRGIHTQRIRPIVLRKHNSTTRAIGCVGTRIRAAPHGRNAHGAARMRADAEPDGAVRCGAGGVAGSACSTGDARSLRHGVALHVACIRMARSAVDAHSVVSQLDRCPVCLFVLLGLRRSTARSSCAAVWYIAGCVSTLGASEALGASLCYETTLAFSARTASCGAEGQYYGRGTTTYGAHAGTSVGPTVRPQ